MCSLWLLTEIFISSGKKKIYIYDYTFLKDSSQIFYASLLLIISINDILYCQVTGLLINSINLN